MLYVSSCTPYSCFEHRPPEPQVGLILSIVIFGHLLSRVSLDTNIILSFLTIALTICGLLLFGSILTRLILLLIFSLMCPRSLAPLLRSSNVTTSASSTTQVSAPSSSPAPLYFGYPALTRPPKPVELSHRCDTH